MNLEHHIGTETHTNLFTEVIPTLRFFSVDRRNRIARLDACNFGRGIFRHKTDNETLIIRFLDAHHIKENQKDKSKCNIHKRTRKSNCCPSANRFPQKIILRWKLTIFNAIWIFTRHGDVAAKGNRRNAVFRLAFLESEKLFAKTHRERIYADLVPLGDNKMTQFVNGHEEAQCQKPQNEHQQII